MKQTTQNRVVVPAKASASTPAVLLGQVEVVHRPGDVEVAVGVEPVDEGRALVAQVALDLEVGVEAENVSPRAVLQPAAELAVSAASER